MELAMEVEELMDVDNCQIESANNLKVQQPLETPAVRNILKAKRRTNTRFGDRTSGQTIVIIDTNIFIDKLEDLKLLFVQLTRQSNKDLILVIPMIVIQELDGLKKSSEISIKRVTSFINEQLEQKSFLLSDVALIKKLRENLDEDDNAETEEIQIFNNDDIILQKCLLIRSLKGDKDRIILLSNDLNLRNKALAVDLKSMNYKAFSEEFFAKKQSEEPISNVQIRGLPKKRKLNNSVPETTCHQRLAKLSRVTEIVSKDEMSTSGKSVTEPKIVKSDVDSGKNWLTCKYEGEKVLCEFIEAALKREYGENLWDKMFSVNPRNASLVELLKVLKQGWYAVFSDQFNRNPNVEMSINKLINSLNNSKNKPHILINQLSALLEQVPSIKCDSNSTSNVNNNKKRRTL
ncbi:transcriptional protein SWT1-like isoform X1 [Leptotrombidium deliense]|uniref:Transcriptional protein SWT1-like isoform X1 n=1 Tax=Leptotrombidium deliense TaxID=299467 RepID=A0A443STV0_9ACAR|nr:transcriptional protein SWT1-like isoform X1 [Leptotrombidium deliense]